MWEKIFTIHIPTKDSDLKYVKNSYKSIRKRQTAQKKSYKSPENVVDKNIQIASTYEKVLNLISHQGNKN